MFNVFIGNECDFYFIVLYVEIDEINEFVYYNINNGVYCVGFVIM